MERASTELVLNILDLALVHGVPAVISIIEAFSEDEITLADIEKLGEKMEPTDEHRKFSE